MKKKALVFALVLMVACAAAAAAWSKSSVGTSSSSGQALSCKGTLKIALVTPLTGSAAFLGAEQASWAKYAVKTLARQLGLKITLVLGDTPVDRGQAAAQALARKYAADSRVVGIIGPATFGTVIASTKSYFRAGLVHISPSATLTALTIGTAQHPLLGTPAFFRDVPGDYAQGPTDARFIRDRLHAKKVVIIDVQDPYSVGLADVVETTLKAGGVSVLRLSAPNATTDYSTYVTSVPSDADVVFFPALSPLDSQSFGRQLLVQGKAAKVFSGDRSNNPAQFNIPGSYVSTFVPDITGIPADAALIAGWKKNNPGKDVGVFGPPAYGAAQILMRAVKSACTAGHGVLGKRRDVIKAMKNVRIKNWILGGSFRFSATTNDPLNAKFSVFQIQPTGSYKLVG